LEKKEDEKQTNKQKRLPELSTVPSSAAGKLPTTITHFETFAYSKGLPSPVPVILKWCFLLM